MASCKAFNLGVFFLTIYYVRAVPSVYPLEDELNPVVNSNVGPIRGLAAEDGDYTMYMGIPYAEIDNNNPFGPATPYPVFEDTFNAYDDSAMCPQREEFNGTVTGSLDCLHLHVYVPNTASTQNPLPVLVWIYGGRFLLGFSGRFIFGPSYLVRHDVIVVLLNYRVGPYGFMCADAPEVPGNQGLKDQVLALRWIKNNIAAFGGDDTKITLSGNSAGAMCSDFHLHYGKEDLFHKIILQSGVALVNSAMTNSNPSAPLLLAEYFDYTPSSIQDALSFLATLPTDQVIVAGEEIGLDYRVCVEKQFDGVESYVSEHPVNVNVPRAKDIEILIGFNNDEGYAGFEFIDDEDYANTDFVQNLLQVAFDFEDENELFQEMKEIMTHFYLGDDDISVELRAQLTDMTSDFSFNYPTLRTVKKFFDNEADSLYLYLFSYDGGRNFLKYNMNITGGGASHADEIGYLFDVSYMEKPAAPKDQLIIDRMTEMWTNFVKYGDPTLEPTELVNLRWPRATKNQWNYMNINTEMSLGSRPFHDRTAFLDLFYRMNHQYQTGYRQPSAASHHMLDLSLLLLLAIRYYF